MERKDSKFVFIEHEAILSHFNKYPYAAKGYFVLFCDLKKVEDFWKKAKEAYCEKRLCGVSRISKALHPRIVFRGATRYHLNSHCILFYTADDTLSQRDLDKPFFYFVLENIIFNLHYTRQRCQGDKVTGFASKIMLKQKDHGIKLMINF
jgi:hypothetical protein